MIPSVYDAGAAAAGGRWHALITAVDSPAPLVSDHPDRVVQGYSVQKLAVAAAVLAEVDRGAPALGALIELTDDLVLGGSGTYHLQPVRGDRITVAGALTAMLLVSDNTAVRMLGRLVPAAAINDNLAGLGFTHTRVEPVADPHRFLLGTTTPRETHDLLWRLATGALLSPASTAFMLGVLRAAGGYHDGVRRVMSSAERARVATKHGADFDSAGAARHEAGVVFGADGAPRMAYAMFAEGLGDRDNYGSTHPAVQVHAALGPALLARCG